MLGRDGRSWSVPGHAVKISKYIKIADRTANKKVVARARLTLTQFSTSEPATLLCIAVFVPSSFFSAASRTKIFARRNCLLRGKSPRAANWQIIIIASHNARSRVIIGPTTVYREIYRVSCNWWHKMAGRW